MPIYKLRKTWIEQNAREEVMYVVADNEQDATDFLSKSSYGELPVGIWRSHDSSSDTIDSDDYEYEATQVPESKITNEGLRKNSLMNITTILSELENEK